MSDNKMPANLMPAFYSWRIHEIATIARAAGYAIAVHGSMQRDLDLVAIPWTERAIAPATLIERLCEGLGIEHRSAPVFKPHGRVAYLLALGGAYQMDLSVMPRAAK
jgi:hypothetical protein